MKQKIIIVGGGTAGHILPAIFVAKEIISKGNEVLMISDDNPLAQKICQDLNIPLKILNSGKLIRSMNAKYIGLNFQNSLKTTKSLLTARKIIKQFSPDKIFCKGGFVTVPIGLIANFYKIPLYLHESDSVIGLANNLLVSKAKILFTGFPKYIYPNKFKNKIVYTSIPIDKNFSPTPFIKNSKKILVIGGSLGSVPVNNLIFNLILLLDKTYEITWITGKSNYVKTKERLASLTKPDLPKIKLIDFSYEIDKLLKEHYLIISRSGANTITEISAVGRPAVFIPFADSARNHQRINAQYLSKKEAGIYFEQDDSPEKLAEIICALKPSQARILAKNISKFYNPSSVQIISERIING